MNVFTEKEGGFYKATLTEKDLKNCLTLKVITFPEEKKEIISKGSSEVDKNTYFCVKTVIDDIKKEKSINKRDGKIKIFWDFSLSRMSSFDKDYEFLKEFLKEYKGEIEFIPFSYKKMDSFTEKYTENEPYKDLLKFVKKFHYDGSTGN
jgi:hypothetical protein